MNYKLRWTNFINQKGERQAKLIYLFNSVFIDYILNLVMLIWYYLSHQ